MKSLAGWGLNVLAVASMPLCLATVVLWVRSYTHDFCSPADNIYYHSGKAWTEAATVDGELYLFRVTGFAITDNGPSASSRFTLAVAGITNGSGTSMLFHVVTQSVRPLDEEYEGFRNRWQSGHVRPFVFSPLGLPPDEQLPTYRLIQLPCWLVAAVFGVLPLWWLATNLRGRMRNIATSQAPACRSCRYDLTGNLSGVCPECGKMIPAKTTG